MVQTVVACPCGCSPHCISSQGCMGRKHTLLWLACTWCKAVKEGTLLSPFDSIDLPYLLVVTFYCASAATSAWDSVVRRRTAKAGAHSVPYWPHMYVAFAIIIVQLASTFPLCCMLDLTSTVRTQAVPNDPGRASSRFNGTNPDHAIKFAHTRVCVVCSRLQQQTAVFSLRCARPFGPSPLAPLMPTAKAC